MDVQVPSGLIVNSVFGLFEVEKSVPIPILSVPPSTKKVCVELLVSILKSTSAPVSLQIIFPPPAILNHSVSLVPRTKFLADEL